jgi:hypothetical protein
MSIKLIAKLTAAATLAVLAGCGGGDPLESEGGGEGGAGEVVVGSADFTENVLRPSSRACRTGRCR